MNMNLAAIATVMGAQVQGLSEELLAAIPVGLQSDSRTLARGELFLCIPGERFDGHDFAAQALEKGALAIVTERDLDLPDGAPILRVGNVLTALGQVARAWRDRNKAKVAGVTGSAGKTTVKELLALVCSMKGATAKNHLNLNNQIGLPLSILQTDGDEEFWVFEAGINYDGEMDILGRILAPDLALIVNVGSVHSQGLGDVAGVARNKAMLLRHLTPGGRAVHSLDYPELVNAVAEYPVTSVGFSAKGKDAPYTGEYLGPGRDGKGRYAVTMKGERVELELPWRGAFMAENLVAAAAAASELGLDVAHIREGLLVAQPAEKRFQRWEKNGLLVVDDTYNANPLSMGQSVLSVVELAEGRPLALVLGEMLELGESAAIAHEELGRAAAISGADLLIWRGGHGQDVQRGLEQADYSGAFATAATPEEFIELWRKQGLENGMVLFKGSRGVRMEEFCNALRRELHA